MDRDARVREGVANDPIVKEREPLPWLPRADEIDAISDVEGAPGRRESRRAHGERAPEAAVEVRDDVGHPVGIHLRFAGHEPHPDRFIQSEGLSSLDEPLPILDARVVAVPEPDGDVGEFLRGMVRASRGVPDRAAFPAIVEEVEILVGPSDQPGVSPALRVKHPGAGVRRAVVDDLERAATGLRDEVRLKPEGLDLTRDVLADLEPLVLDPLDDVDDDWVALPRPVPVAVGGTRRVQRGEDHVVGPRIVVSVLAVQIVEEERVARGLRARWVPDGAVAGSVASENLRVDIIPVEEVIQRLADLRDRERIEDSRGKALVHRDRVDE